MEQYFNYLVGLISTPDGREKSYTYLLNWMAEKDFYWLKEVPLDEAREQRGLDIRRHYYEILDEDSRVAFVHEIGDKKCSLLEMFVAFAIDVNDALVMSDNTYYEYFWLFIDNLYLDWADDEDFDEKIVENTFENLLSRTYKNGGIFSGMPKNFCGFFVDCKMNFVDLWSQAMNYFAKFR